MVEYEYSMIKTKSWRAKNNIETVRIYLPALSRRYEKSVRQIVELTVCETACAIAREHGKVNCKGRCPFDVMWK